MSPTTPNLDTTLQALDAINRLDPNTETDLNDEPWPKELLYAERMSLELSRFAPQANIELKIAARAQHIERWIIPRSDYPMNRAGYQRWRITLGEHHAKRACELMRAHGFSEESCERVAAMLQKKQLKQNPDVQTLEDVACLVFIRHYLEKFATQHSDEKLIRIIGKTWNKMSQAGQSAALQIDLPAHLQRLMAAIE